MKVTTYIFSLLFLCTIFKAWTLCNHPVVTSFVDDTSAHLTLIALLSQTPAKILYLHVLISGLICSRKKCLTIWSSCNASRTSAVARKLPWTCARLSDGLFFSLHPFFCWNPVAPWTPEAFPLRVLKHLMFLLLNSWLLNFNQSVKKDILKIKITYWSPFKNLNEKSS